jgi:cobalamin biosynthesis Mg chelatase CobN
LKKGDDKVAKDDSAAPPPGPGVDARGVPVVDPTANVSALFAAGMKRQDDLREMESRWRDRMDTIRSSHTREMRDKEAERINAIRQVDVEASQQQQRDSEARAATLAKQVTDAAEVQRNLVATTAAAQQTSLRSELQPIQASITALTQRMYEQQGQKQQVTETRAGFSGVNTIISIVLGVIALVAVLFAIQRGNSSSPTPTVNCTATYHPAPCP